MRDVDLARNHRLALVTVATGKAIAVEIARQPGYRLVLLCRDENKAMNALYEACLSD